MRKFWYLILILFFSLGCETLDTAGESFLFKDAESVLCAWDSDPLSISPFGGGYLYDAPSTPEIDFVPSWLYESSQSDDLPATLLSRLEIVRESLLGLTSVNIWCEGMSNGLSEFDQLAIDYPNVSDSKSHIFIENGAAGGYALSDWVDRAPNDPSALPDVVLMKHSNNRPQGKYDDGKIFPEHAESTARDYVDRVRSLVSSYPSIQLILIAGRSYGGFSCETGQYRHPVEWEEYFSISWAINELSQDPNMPLVIWGPRLWDGTQERDYFLADGVHPSALGRLYVSGEWLALLRELLGDVLFGDPVDESYTHRINSGGSEAILNSSVFAADTYFAGGNLFGSGGVLTTGRKNGFSYFFDGPDTLWRDVYLVFDTVKQRGVFDVHLNGVVVLGGYQPSLGYTRLFLGEYQGSLQIDFVGQRSFVNGIEILEDF